MWLNRQAQEYCSKPLSWRPPCTRNVVHRNRASHMCHTINLGNVHFLTLYPPFCIPAIFYLLFISCLSHSELQVRCTLALVAEAFSCRWKTDTEDNQNAHINQAMYRENTPTVYNSFIITILPWCSATVTFRMSHIVFKRLITGWSGLVMCCN